MDHPTVGGEVDHGLAVEVLPVEAIREIGVAVLIGVHVRRIHVHRAWRCLDNGGPDTDRIPEFPNAMVVTLGINDVVVGVPEADAEEDHRSTCVGEPIQREGQIVGLGNGETFVFRVPFAHEQWAPRWVGGEVGVQLIQKTATLSSPLPFGSGLVVLPQVKRSVQEARGRRGPLHQPGSICSNSKQHLLMVIICI